MRVTMGSSNDSDARDAFLIDTVPCMLPRIDSTSVDRADHRVKLDQDSLHETGLPPSREASQDAPAHLAPSGNGSDLSESVETKEHLKVPMRLGRSKVQRLPAPPPIIPSEACHTLTATDSQSANRVTPAISWNDARDLRAAEGLILNTILGVALWLGIIAIIKLSLHF